MRLNEWRKLKNYKIRFIDNINLNSEIIRYSILFRIILQTIQVHATDGLIEETGESLRRIDAFMAVAF